MSSGLRERKKVALRERIMEVSMRHFAAVGFEQTTVDTICADLHIGKATFFRYFASKAAVVRAVGEAAIETMVDQIDVDSVSAANALREWYDRVAVEMVGAAALTKTLVDSGALDPRLHIGEKPLAHLPFLEAVIERGLMSGEFTADLPAREVAYAVDAVMYDATLRRLSHPDFAGIPPDLGRPLELVLGGLRT
jgi:AcrR family transcriptional regulator